MSNTQEQTVKRLPNGAKLIASSAWRWASKSQEETMITRAVLGEMGDNIVSWQEFQEIDHLGNPVRPRTVWGHYTKNVSEAEKEFQNRARLLIKTCGSALQDQSSYETAT